MIDAARCGALSLVKLEAMTAVCSVGLDMIAIPGDTPAEVISAIIADEAAIGMVNSKTTAVRLIPAIGKRQARSSILADFWGRPLLWRSTGIPQQSLSTAVGIPAPMQSLKIKSILADWINFLESFPNFPLLIWQDLTKFVLKSPKETLIIGT